MSFGRRGKEKTRTEPKNNNLEKLLKKMHTILKKRLGGWHKRKNGREWRMENRMGVCVCVLEGAPHTPLPAPLEFESMIKYSSDGDAVKKIRFFLKLL